DPVARLPRSLQLQGPGPAEARGLAVGRRTRAPAHGQDPAPGRQRAAARRALQPPGRGNPARARGCVAGIPGQRVRDLARPLVPGPHRHPHPGLRGRLARGVLPGQLPRVRGRQEAPPGRRRGSQAPALQGAQVTASRSRAPAREPWPARAGDLRDRPMGFIDTLRKRWQAADTLVCVGLDPEPAKFPARFTGDPDAVFNFCRDIADATAEYACAFKPQIAHFAALGADDALARLIAHLHAAHPGIPVILDAKRGDIGSTARHYASEAFDRYRADAVTANPYLGRDSVQPFLDRADRGVVILCRTSNPGAADLQDLPVRTGAGERRLYQHIAQTIARAWNRQRN